MDAARLVRLVTRPRAVTTRVTRFHAAVLRAARGRVKRSLLLGGGQPVLSLETVGRRSGIRRSTAVAYLRDRDGWAIFGMNLGSESDPAWSRNLEARQDAVITVDGRSVPVTARRVHGSEAERLWRLYAERLPAVERFRAIAGREIPAWLLEERSGPPEG